MTRKTRNNTTGSIKIIYNNDIDVDHVFASQFDGLTPLLRNEELIQLFKKYDQTAKNRKRRLLAFGRLSLLLTLLALLGVLTELLIAAQGSHAHSVTVVIIELLAIAAFGCLFANHIQKNRPRYLLACFCRERIRQWQYQLFLDGEFVSRYVDDSDWGQRELDSRFERLCEDLRNTDGLLHDYQSAATTRSMLMHPNKSYTSAATAALVNDAMKTLRFDHQVRYSGRKISDDPNDQHFSLREQHHWAETVARLSLLAAVAIPALQLALVSAKGLGLGTEALATTHVFLLAAALAAVVISATARAYTTGMTLPDEIDSYEHYCAHVNALRSVFIAETDHEKKRECHVELELEAERELRRFIHMKQKATFLA